MEEIEETVVEGSVGIDWLGAGPPITFELGTPSTFSLEFVECELLCISHIEFWSTRASFQQRRTSLPFPNPIASYWNPTDVVYVGFDFYNLTYLLLGQHRRGYKS